MKRIISILVVFSLILAEIPVVHSVASEEEVYINLSNKNITDEQLAEMVANGEIPQDVTTLLLNNNKISDLTPLSGLTNLQYLILNSNQISDLTPLSGLTNLVDLNLSSNTKIIDLTPLGGLTNLERLRFYLSFQIIDITPLASLTNLKHLEFCANKISDLTPLSGLTNLYYLRLDANQISDLTPLSGLSNLKFLYLRSNQINDLTPLGELTNLRDLDLSFNPVSLERVKALEASLPECKINHNTVLVLGHVLGNDKISIGDALEILKYLAGMKSVIYPGNDAWYAAVITPESQKAYKPGIGDVLEILKK